MMGRMLYKLGFVAFVLLAVISCEQVEIPEEQQSTPTPTFYLRASVNGQPLAYEAGVNNMVLETNVREVNDQLVEFNSFFSESDCADCPGAFHIELAADDVSVATLQTLAATQLNYLPAIRDTTYLVTFIPEVETGLGAEPSIKWIFGNGQTSTENRPVRTYSKKQNINVSLEASVASFSDDITKTIPIGNPCAADIDIEKQALSNTFRFSVLSERSDISSIQWAGSFGIKTQSNFIHTYPTGTQKDEITLTINYTDGCTAVEKKQLIVDDQNPANMAVNFSYEVEEEITAEIEEQLTQVELVYYNQEGKRYSSALGNQAGATAFFDIVSIAPYQANEAGKNTYKVELAFAATLVASDGDVLSFKNGEAMIAFQVEK